MQIERELHFFIISCKIDCISKMLFSTSNGENTQDTSEGVLNHEKIYQPIYADYNIEWIFHFRTDFYGACPVFQQPHT